MEMEQLEVIGHSDASSARTVHCDGVEDERDQTEIPEKDGELKKDLASAVEEYVEQPEAALYGEHPDGGLRAWLVVTGVSPLSLRAEPCILMP